MTSTTLDRLAGVSSAVAIKAPVRAATTANIALQGLQTIDDVALVEGDRVLVMAQTDKRQNGIYLVSTGVWQRVRDFNSTRDVVTGTRVYVVAGTVNGEKDFAVVTVLPRFVIGTDEIEFGTINVGAQGPEGPQGPQGDPGVPFTVNAVGDLADRDDYDDEEAGFSYLAQDTGDLYIKLTSANADWSDPIPFRGPQGLPGNDGADGAEVEMQTNATHIQWRYVGDPTWTDLIALADIEGPQGDPGPTGAAGSSTLTGSGVPSDGDGNDDDIYIDGDTGDLYVKVAGSWGATGGNIAGPKGDTGEPGAGLEINATGLYTDLSTYDNEDEGFVFLSTDGDGDTIETGVLFIMGPGGAGDWSDPIPFQGPAGEDGINGTDGALLAVEEVKTGNYTILAGDTGKTIVANSGSAIAFSLQAAATLGSTFMIVVQNANTGLLTIDPDGSETINSDATLQLEQGGSALIWCNGSVLRALISYPIAGQSVAEAGTSARFLMSALNVAQAITAQAVRKAADTALTAGYTATAVNDGTKSSGTYTPTPAGGNLKRAVNGGAHTLAAPSASGDYTIIIQYTNNASAGAITLSGFSKTSGDSFTTTNGHDFFVYITKVNGFTHAQVTALQ